MSIEILDSTLREGEQSPGVNFTPEQRVEIAIALDEIGVEYIEAGHPSVSEDVFRGIKDVVEQGLKANILVHSRAKREDIDMVLRTEAPWIGMFFCVSSHCLKMRFGITLEEAKRRIVDTIEYAKAHGLKIRFTPEDTTRTEWENLANVLEILRELKVDRVSVADTTGVAHPVEFYNLVKKVAKYGVAVHVHCHNDLGLAFANALMGIEAGAIVVDTTVNGIGERCGIVDLAQMATIARYRYGKKYKLDKLYLLSRRIEEITGIAVEKHHPIVGEHAFVHKAGLHVAAVVKDPSFYEFMPAEMFGRERKIYVDKYAGRATVEYYLNRAGLKNGKVVKELLARIKSSGRVYTPAMLVEEARKIEREVI